MKFSLKSLFVASFVSAGVIWLVVMLVGIRAKEVQRAISLERNSYITSSDDLESLRKQIGRAINDLGHADSLTIANVSIYFHTNVCQIGLHCVGWRQGDISTGELSNGESVIKIELTPLEHYDDGVLFIFSGILDVDWATLETKNFEDFKIRLLDHEGQALTEWSSVWVWDASDEKGFVIYQSRQRQLF